jgi:leader peptidase (prepilin peptidase)/N-methyltransferase
MHALVIIFIGILGLIVGSFLNVVILRMNTGKGLGGRSMCLSCNKVLHWHELVPVVSFLMLKGKCSKCHSRISWQYPIVELMTGLLFASVAWNIHEPIRMILWLGMVSLGIIISVYDYYHQVIPIKPLIALAVGAFLLGFHIFGAIMVALPFLALWFISLGKWIGFGDVEIIAVIGLALGVGGGFSAVILGFWIACLVVLPTVLYLKYHHKKYRTEIPFGPFLLLGMYLAGVWGVNIVTLVSNVVH